MAITRKYKGWLIISENFTDTRGEDRLIVAAMPLDEMPVKEHFMTTNKVSSYWYNHGGTKEWDMFSSFDFAERSDYGRRGWLEHMKQKIDKYLGY